MINEFLNLPWPRILLLFGFFYLLLLLFAWVYADRILFPAPQSASYTKEEVDFYVPISNGLQIACIKIESTKPSDLTVLYSHGNGEDLGNVRGHLSSLSRFGCNFVSYDYPGYGLSQGDSSEDGCNLAIEAVYRYLVKDCKIDPNKVVLWGRSLGTGPSCFLASKEKVGGLLLETPFLSAFRTVTEIPILPWDRFRNIDFAPLVKCASLVIHGKMDEVIPFRQGRKIYKLLPEPKTFLELSDASHNDITEKGGRLYQESIQKFFGSLNND